MLEAFPEIADIINDSPEQPRGQPKTKTGTTPGKKAVGRPKDQKKYFSVNKGTHTRKTQVAVTLDGLVVHLSAPAGGRTHDMRVLKQSRLLGRLPRGSRIWGDRGYTGLHTLCPEHDVITFQMRPRGGTLSEEQRELKHHISKVRITVENVVCKIKRFGSAGSSIGTSCATMGSSEVASLAWSTSARWAAHHSSPDVPGHDEGQA